MKIRSTFWALCIVTFGLSSLAGQIKKPLEVADKYLQDHATELGLTSEDASHYQVSSYHVSKHNKLTHVYLKQSWADIPVANAILNLNIAPDGKMIYVGNRFLPKLSERVNTTQARLTPTQAIAAFTQQMRLPVVNKWTLIEASEGQEFTYAPGGQALEPIRVKLIYQPLADKTVRLAWRVDYYQLDAEHWWLGAIDAVSGELIDLFDQVIHCNFAEDATCEANHTHHTTHELASARWLTPPPDGQEDGIGVYRALPMTVESPSHGETQRLMGPADTVASPYGWHDIDGVIGAEYTITRGNNVHAYHDIFDLNSSSGDEPDGGDSLVFDFPVLTANRPYSYRDALVTNLFYWNNLMHDLWYKYGFDEDAGNFQATNYESTLGEEDDFVRAEALDGRGTNNANFATPVDGNRPRMQMYLWGGSLPDFEGASLIARNAEAQEQTYDFIQMAFGGELPSFENPLNAEAVLIQDGVGVTSDACEPITNGAELAGKIALVDRGDCEFGFKALAAQEAGAIGVVICNDRDTPIFDGGGGEVGDQVTVPVVMVSLPDCNEMKIWLPGLQIRLYDRPLLVPDPGPTGRSSDFDNGIIAHEYTHGISTRLTGGRENSSCLRNVEQAGEGWSDWFGMVMTTTADMTAEQRRGVGTYAGNQPTNGTGIRTYPYSRDMGVNPHTYADINRERIPHGVGSVWCVMIWDLYWDLIDEYGFDEDLYNGTGGNNIAMQLVLDGLKIQPCDPDFIDARDAILAADEINNEGANRCLIWETFARRGLGVDAQGGGIESFDVPNTCLNAFVVDKRAVQEVFAGETITYELDIINGKSIGVDTPILLDTLPPGVSLLPETVTCPYTIEGNVIRIELDPLSSGQAMSCSYTVETSPDDFSYVAFFDGLEGSLENFSIETDLGNSFWRRKLNDAYEGRFSWHSDSPDEAADHSLITVPFELPAGERPGFSFYHRYATEASWDGGVVEMTTDEGVTWFDLGPYMIKGRYSGRLDASDSNPLSGRPAFTGTSSGEWIETIIDLEPFAGQEVQIRFRYGADENTAEEGWFVDNITLFGNLLSLTNVICAQDEEGEYCSEATTVVFAMPVSTDDLQADLPLQVYPNPTSDRLYIRLGAELEGSLTLNMVNLAGQRVSTQEFNAGTQLELDVNNLPAGIYFLQLQSAKGQASRKVIIQ